MAHDLFVSYSSRDKATADAVCASLEGNGIRCWIAPRDVLPGVEWGEAIVNAIHESKVMVMVFSARANESRHIRREVERAVSQGIAIVPFRIEDIVPSNSLQYFIGNLHWLDALTTPLEYHLSYLASKVKVLLSQIGAGEKPEEVKPPPQMRRQSPGEDHARAVSQGIAQYCTQCGAANIARFKFCTDCGASVVINRKACGGCGEPVEQGLKFCTNCGVDFCFREAQTC
ncbi:MAG: TIR domain-containing protein [Gammaproteobacteria bacterium]